MPATPSIEPSHGTIAAKTATSTPPAASGDAFGQVLKSVSEAASGVAPARTNDAHEALAANAPGDPASEAKDQPPATATSAQAAERPGKDLRVEAVPVEPATAASTPAAAAPGSGDVGGAKASGKPAHARKPDSAAGTSQTADPTAAAASTSAPVPASPAITPDSVAASWSALAVPGADPSPAARPTAPASKAIVAGAHAIAAGAGATATGADAAAPGLGSAGSTAVPMIAVAMPVTQVADVSMGQGDLMHAAPASARSATAEDPTGPSRSTRLASADKTVAADPTGFVAPVADPKVALHPADAAPVQVQHVEVAGLLIDQAVPTSAPTAWSTPLVAVATPPAHTGSPAAMVEQVAPAIFTLAKTADGNQQMTVRLQPEELGMVQVRIARAASGATQIEVTAEKPDTLLAMQRDQPQLHHTLDEAGIPAAGRTITFHVAPPAQTSGGNLGSSSGTSQQNAGSRWSGGNMDGGGGGGGGGRDNHHARPSSGYFSARQIIDPAESAAATLATATKTYRVGLDITA